MTKGKAQIKHAYRRYEERFGKKLKQHEYQRFIGAVRRGRATLVAKQTNRVFLYVLDDVYFIYDKIRRNVVTFLTAPMAVRQLQNRKWKHINESKVPQLRP